jgi:hypothetical protein
MEAELLGLFATAFVIRESPLGRQLLDPATGRAQERGGPQSGGKEPEMRA